MGRGSDAARAADRRTVLALVFGASAIACVAAPFTVIAQRNAPKPPPLAAVTHTPLALLTVNDVAAEAAPERAPELKAAPHTFRVADLATDSRVSIVTGTLGKHPFLAALTTSGLSQREAHRVLVGFSGIRNLDRCDPHDSFTYAKSTTDNHVVAFELVPAGAMEHPSLDLFQEREDADKAALTATRVSIAIERRRVAVGLVVGDDLQASLTSANLNDKAAALLDDALDGHAELSDLRAGTRLRIIATEERIEGAFAAYAPIDAVEYTPAPHGGTQKPAIRVYWFGKAAAQRTPSRNDTPRGSAPSTNAYYDSDGRQPYHGGWRAPIPMARISSRFNPNRMHPVLHVVMPHNGVDFAASAGTPVYSAAAGVIRSVGDGGPCGNMVQIDHPNGLISAYCHLSRFGPISAGERVDVRQLIGYVGQTGRATGPHLHFAVKRMNASGMEVFVDPLTMRLDGVRIIPPRLRPDFDELKRTLDALIDPIPLPLGKDSTATATEKEPDETE